MKCGRPQLDPWVRNIPWTKARQPTPAFLPRELHGQRSLAGYSPWAHVFIMLYVTSLVLICNWKCVHFAYLHPISLLLPSIFK